MVLKQLAHLRAEVALLRERRPASTAEYLDVDFKTLATVEDLHQLQEQMSPDLGTALVSHILLKKAL